MKRLKRLFIPMAFLFMMQNGFSAVPFAIPSPESPNQEAIRKKERERIIMQQIVKLTPREYGELRGKKLNFFERLTFKATQKRMKMELQKADTFSGFNAGGFFLGLLLGILGVIGAYIFSTDENFRKWTWIGFGVAVVLYLLVFVL